MKILVTGSSGYVGSRVVPRLLAEGHTVRAGFTDVDKAAAFWWAQHCEVVRLDVLEQSTVAAGVEGTDAVLYLVHSMAGGDFAEKDRTAARGMARACADAGVERIVYLSGIVPRVPEAELSEHIRSRLEVERLLTESGVPTISLRAAVIVGAGSTSFEIIRQISERLPVHAIPVWMDSRVQPIALVDVLEAIVGALRVQTASRCYDIGGPDRMPYAQLLSRYAEIAQLNRPQVGIPGLPTELVGMLAGALTDVPSATVEALIESLQHDMVAGECDFTDDLLPEEHPLLGLEDSIRRALAEPDEAIPAQNRDPMAAMPFDPGWSGGQGGGIASALAGLSAVTSAVTSSVAAAVRDTLNPAPPTTAPARSTSSPPSA